MDCRSRFSFCQGTFDFRLCPVQLPKDNYSKWCFVHYFEFKKCGLRPLKSWRSANVFVPTANLAMTSMSKMTKQWPGISLARAQRKLVLFSEGDRDRWRRFEKNARYTPRVNDKAVRKTKRKPRGVAADDVPSSLRHAFTFWTCLITHHALLPWLFAPNDSYEDTVANFTRIPRNWVFLWPTKCFRFE